MSLRKPKDLHTRAGLILTVVCGAAFIFVMAEAIAWGLIFDLQYVFLQSSLLHCVVLGALFLLSALFEKFRWIQPAICMAIGLAIEVVDPRTNEPLYFFIVAISLLIRYGFFSVRPTFKAALIFATVTIAGVAGAFLNLRIPPAPIGRSDDLLHLLSYPFMTACLAVVEYAIFAEWLKPLFFPSTTPTATYFIGESYNLTEREFDVLIAVIRHKGADTKLVADELGITVSTVDTHLKHIYTKIGCGRTRQELVAFLIPHRICYTRAEADADQTASRLDMANKLA